MSRYGGRTSTYHLFNLVVSLLQSGVMTTVAAEAIKYSKAQDKVSKHENFGSIHLRQAWVKDLTVT